MKRIIYILVLFPIVTLGQSTSENYVKTVSYKVPTTMSVSSPDIDIAATTVTYFDGLGRPIQKIANKQSSNDKDIITHIEYDQFGRVEKEYLPFESGQDDMSFDTHALQNTLNFPRYQNQFPYSQKEFEQSPLQRISKQSFPGQDWKMGNGHEVRYDYKLNAIQEVINFSVSSSGSLIHYGYYKPNLVYKSIIKNENWTPSDGNNNTTEEFKDSFGRVILKRSFNENTSHDTYYVYDKLGNLTFVLPPLFFENFTMPSGPPPNTCTYQKIYYFTTFVSPLGDPNAPIPGGGSVKISISNGIVTLALGGAFNSCMLNENANPIIVDDPSTCPLPNMTIGEVKFGTLAYDYLAYIENNRLRIVKKNSWQQNVQIDHLDDIISTPIEQLYTETVVQSQFLDGLCYQYKYDKYRRLIEKKLPGKNWEFIAYNSQGKPVASGPALNPFGGTNVGWIVTKYDIFGRTVYTVWYDEIVNENIRSLFESELTDNWSESYTLNAVALEGKTLNYTNNTFPKQRITLLTINYYDNYDFDGMPTLPNDVLGERFLTSLKTLQTGTWTRIPDSPGTAKGELSYKLYDSHSRPIRSEIKLYTGGLTQIDSKLDFMGKPIFTVTTHKRKNTDEVITVSDSFSYTHQDRLDTHTQQINNLAVETISKNTYDNLGQLISKEVGTDPVNSTPLQKVDFSYNIRGWLTQINNITNLASGSDPLDLFAFKINYNEDTLTQQSLPSTKLYNGNIAETYWLSASDNILRNYNYTYDKLNRLTDAVYQKPNNSNPTTNMYNESLKYDKNGNILTLQRNGENDSNIYTVIPIDDLTFTYDNAMKNRLMKVVDRTEHPKGFKDNNTSTGNDYSYDEFGNMTSDLNKKIASITYNHLNLPSHLTFGNGDKIDYIYDAAGQKRRKLVTESGVTTETDYLGGYQYTNGVLNFFNHAEGYVNVGYCADCQTGHQQLFNYVYSYKDHLGNIRENYAFDKKTSSVKILEENHYYPFGLKHQKYNSSFKTFVLDNESVDENNKMKIAQVSPGDANLKSNNYKYQEQEWQDELGLNWYSFKWRNYDPAIGRFMCIDPLAEKYTYNGVYNFSENRVIDARELEGLESIQINALATALAVKLKSVFNSGLNSALGNTTPNTPTVTIGGINPAKVVKATQTGEAAKKKAVEAAKNAAVVAGDALEKTGDAAVKVAPAADVIVPGAGEVIGTAGEGLSKAGTVLKATVDVVNGDNDKAVEKVATEVVTGAAANTIVNTTGASEVTSNAIVAGAKEALEPKTEEKKQ